MGPLFRVKERFAVHRRTTRHHLGRPADAAAHDPAGSPAGSAVLHRMTPHRLTIALLLALGLFAALFGGIVATAETGDAQSLPPGGSFLDEDLSVHEGYIEAIAAQGVTLGCDYQQYCPDAEVTREQMASFIARALDLPAATQDYFTDDENSPHQANINKLAEAEITFGCGGTSYCPLESVERDQMASFLARAFALAGSGTDHFDDDNGNPHETNINKMADNGITLGCGGSSYCPEAVVARDQMASFLGRGMGLSQLSPPFPVRTLVDKFYEWQPTRSDIKRYEVDDMYYYPRQFATGFTIDVDGDNVVTNAGQFAGWDVLRGSSWSDRQDSGYFNFFLTRPTTVALVWHERWDAHPSWLANWTLGGTVEVDNNVLNVYERDLGYGWQSLASASPNADGSQMYTVLLAERGGSPSVAPPVPAGMTEPTPNELCPVWVHDSYTTIAPDGQEYQTWHPQIDPTYWCHFGHEHGSDPRLIPGAPFVGYGYVAAKVPQEEPNIGFKESIFRTPGGSWVRFIDHATTAQERRVCAQLHTVYVMVYDAAGNEKFRTGFKADFGISESAEEGDLITPSDCGYDMAALAEITKNEKRIRTTAASNDYEQWRSGPSVQTNNLGMVFNHAMDIRDPFTHCNGLSCASVSFHAADRDQTGTKRTIDNSRGNDWFVFDARTALGSGTFYTDPYGNSIVASDDAHAVEQYIEPGFYMNLSSLADDDCNAVEPWTMFYECQPDMSVGRVNISNSLDPAGWLQKLTQEAAARGDSLLAFRCTILTTLTDNPTGVETLPATQPLPEGDTLELDPLMRTPGVLSARAAWSARYRRPHPST